MDFLFGLYLLNLVLKQRNQSYTRPLKDIGGYVSCLNGCNYCVQHHFTGMARHLHDDMVSEQIRTSLEADTPDTYFAGKELAILVYVGPAEKVPSALDISRQSEDVY